MTESRYICRLQSLYSKVKILCVDILWLYIGLEFAVLAVSLSLGRQKTECHAV